MENHKQLKLEPELKSSGKSIMIFIKNGVPLSALKPVCNNFLDKYNKHH